MTIADQVHAHRARRAGAGAGHPGQVHPAGLRRAHPRRSSGLDADGIVAAARDCSPEPATRVTTPADRPTTSTPPPSCSSPCTWPTLADAITLPHYDQPLVQPRLEGEPHRGHRGRPRDRDGHRRRGARAIARTTACSARSTGWSATPTARGDGSSTPSTAPATSSAASPCGPRSSRSPTPSTAPWWAWCRRRRWAVAWWAAKGLGAFADGRRAARCRRCRALDEAQVSVTFSSGWDDLGPHRRAGASCSSAAYRARGFGDFWQHMLVAEGAVDLAVDAVGLQPYDLAAVMVVVEEAGGTFTDRHGERTFAAATPRSARTGCCTSMPRRCCLSTDAMHDLVIRNAFLVDGSGAPGRPADIAVDGDIDHRRRAGRAPAPRHTHRSTPTGCWSPRASSTCTRTTTRRPPGTRGSRRRAGTASPPS